MLVIEVDEVEAVDVIVGASGCIGSLMASIAWRSPSGLRHISNY